MHRSIDPLEIESKKDQKAIVLKLGWSPLQALWHVGSRYIHHEQPGELEVRGILVGVLMQAKPKYCHLVSWFKRTASLLKYIYHSSTVDSFSLAITWGNRGV
jgi:hypothetical protein